MTCEQMTSERDKGGEYEWTYQATDDSLMPDGSKSGLMAHGGIKTRVT